MVQLQNMHLMYLKINDSHNFEICIVECRFCGCRRLLMVVLMWSLKRAFLAGSWQCFVLLIPRIQWLRRLEHVVSHPAFSRHYVEVSAWLFHILLWISSNEAFGVTVLMGQQIWSFVTVVLLRALLGLPLGGDHLPERKLWLGGFHHWKVTCVISN